jgi:hypothetical protein
VKRALVGVCLVVSLLATSPGPAPALAGAGDTAALSVWSGGAWREWWRADREPERWEAADTTVTATAEWRALAPGLEWTEIRLACPAPLWRARLIVARLDPRVLSLSLEMDLTRDRRPAWTIDRAPRDALFAVNAGQFDGGSPWGWVAMDGRVLLPPGYGPLASALTIDGRGGVRWAHGDSGAVALAPAGLRLGLQSYPTLLAGDGVVPQALRTGEGGLDLRHRDARLAIGSLRDGRLLVVLTRFDAVGPWTSGLPMGPTTPEMAAIMGALGTTDAVMLDGGISAQLLLRDAPGRTPHRWSGWRKVPLALIAKARPVTRGN